MFRFLKSFVSLSLVVFILSLVVRQAYSQTLSATPSPTPFVSPSTSHSTSQSAKKEEAQLSKSLSSSKLSGIIKTEIGKASIGTDISVFDKEIFEGVSIAMKYRYQVEPTWQNGFYSRYDRYVLNTNLNPGDWVNLNQIGLNIGQNSEVLFVRQFPSQWEAAKALPYGLDRLPFKSKDALTKLAIGDFVSFTANLNMITSIGSVMPLAGGTLSAQASMYALVSGEFLVHLFKVDNQRMRVKLIALRNKEGGVNASIGLANPLVITGLKLLDNRVSEVLDLNPLSAHSATSKKHLLMADYVFDLKNPQAAKAYESIVNQTYQFKDVSLLNPFNDRKRLEGKLLTNILPAETIFYEDMKNQIPEKSRRIDRIFKGDNESESINTNFRFGLKTFRFTQDSTYSQNHIASENRDGKLEKFIFDSFAKVFDTQFLFGLFGSTHTMTMSLLNEADDSFEPTQFIALILSRERKMKTLSVGDQRDIKNHLLRVLGPNRFSQVNWGDFKREEDRTLSRLNSQLVFHTKAYEAAPNLSYAEAYELFRKFLASGPHPKTIDYSKLPGDINLKPPYIEKPEYEDDIQTIAATVASALHSGVDKSERLNAFLSIRDMPLWQEVGAPFLMSLLPQDRLNELVYFEFKWDAKGVVVPATYSFGLEANQELYKSLIYIQNVMNDRSVDLKLLQ